VRETDAVETLRSVIRGKVVAWATRSPEVRKCKTLDAAREALGNVNFVDLPQPSAEQADAVCLAAEAPGGEPQGSMSARFTFGFRLLGDQLSKSAMGSESVVLQVPVNAQAPAWCMSQSKVRMQRLCDVVACVCERALGAHPVMSHALEQGKLVLTVKFNTHGLNWHTVPHGRVEAASLSAYAMRFIDVTVRKALPGIEPECIVQIPFPSVLAGRVIGKTASTLQRLQVDIQRVASRRSARCQVHVTSMRLGRAKLVKVDDTVAVKGGDSRVSYVTVCYWAPMPPIISVVRSILNAQHHYIRAGRRRLSVLARPGHTSAAAAGAAAGAATATQSATRRTSPRAEALPEISKEVQQCVAPVIARAAWSAQLSLAVRNRPIRRARHAPKGNAFLPEEYAADKVRGMLKHTRKRQAQKQKSKGPKRGAGAVRVASRNKRKGGLIRLHMMGDSALVAA